MATDEQLMEAYARGDRSAFDLLVRRHENAVNGFLLRITRDEVLAEDAMVETFFKLSRAAAGYEPRQRFLSFLFKIAYREGITVLRQHHKGPRIIPFPGGDGSGLEIDADPRDSVDTPERQTELRQTLRAVDRVLLRLPDAQRAIFHLCYCEGLSHSDIAETLEVPPGTVRSYLSLARKAVREALEDEDVRPPECTVARAGR